MTFIDLFSIDLLYYPENEAVLLFLHKHYPLKMQDKISQKTLHCM